MYSYRLFKANHPINQISPLQIIQLEIRKIVYFCHYFMSHEKHTIIVKTTINTPRIKIKNPTKRFKPTIVVQ